MRISLYLLMFFTLFTSYSFSCDHSLIAKIESKYKIPTGLLKSIALVESNINPYALNIAGSAFYGSSTDHVHKEIQKHLKKGVTSIDIGCMQLNYKYHGKHFRDISHMLEPEANVEYAAKLLTSLHQTTGQWAKAVGRYHSNHRARKIDYMLKVVKKWIHNA